MLHLAEAVMVKIPGSRIPDVVTRKLDLSVKKPLQGPPFFSRPAIEWHCCAAYAGNAAEIYHSHRPLDEIGREK